VNCRVSVVPMSYCTGLCYSGDGITADRLVRGQTFDIAVRPPFACQYFHIHIYRDIPTTGDS